MSKTKEETRTVEEIKANLPKLERRFLGAELELRQAQGKSKIAMFVPFDRESEGLFFREIIRDTAFDKTLKDGADVVSMWNHDSSWVLGRRSNRTLKLAKLDDGLEGEASLDDEDPMHRHFARRVERGDVKGTSFMFRPIKDRWTQEEDQEPIRELLEVELLTLDPVTFPAYPESSSEARAQCMTDVACVRLGFDEMASVVCRIKGGETREDDVEILQRWLGELSGYLPKPESMPPDVLASRVQRLDALAKRYPAA